MHFGSILDAPGHNNEAQNAFPSSAGQNLEFADGSGKEMERRMSHPSLRMLEVFGWLQSHQKSLIFLHFSSALETRMLVGCWLPPR